MLVTTAVLAADGYTIEAGQGQDSTKLVRLHGKWNWDRKWFDSGNWQVVGYWEAGLGRWLGSGTGARDLWDVGLTPVFRLEPKGAKQRMYFEAGVGAHLLSATRINDVREFSSSFQFGSLVGVGRVFGDRGQFDLGFRFQHLSNADLALPNDGINFSQLRFTYNY